MSKILNPTAMISLDLLDELTSQELKILRFSVQELTCKEIAETLHISPQTVERHRKNILSKLGLSGKIAFRKALRQIDILLKMS